MANETEDRDTKVEKAAETSKKSGPSTFTKLRYSRNVRLGVIVFLLIVVAIMFYFWTKFRIVLAIAFLALLAALGLEITQNDWDLGKLWETQSFEQSKVSRDTMGNILFDKQGNVTTNSDIGKAADDYNCDDFSNQPEAQTFFTRVGGTDHDLNRLDGDKDGEACESLPKGK